MIFSQKTEEKYRQYINEQKKKFSNSGERTTTD